MRWIVLASLVAACSPRQDVVDTTAKATTVTGESAQYLLVHKRTHSTVALAESPFSAAFNESFVVVLSNAFETCAEEFLKSGMLAKGAARAIARFDEKRAMSIDLKLSSGDDAARNAIGCLLPTLKQASFPLDRTDGGTLSPVVIDVLWQP